MKALTILVDMDDVLWDLLSEWIARLNVLHGSDISPEDITDWRMVDFFSGLTQDEVFAPIFDPDIWTKLNPIPGAYAALRRLIDEGHKIRVVTATHYATAHPKIEAFLSMYSFLKYEDVIIASDKSIVKGDIVIDDAIHNLESASGIKILFDRPHNRCYAAGDFYRAKTWEDIYKFIQEVSHDY